MEQGAKKEKSTFLIVISVINIIVFIIGACVLYLLITQRTKTSSDTNTKTEENVSKTANWKIYENKDLDYEIKYPKDWIYKVEKYGYIGLSLYGGDYTYDFLSLSNNEKALSENLLYIKIGLQQGKSHENNLNLARKGIKAHPKNYTNYKETFITVANQSCLQTSYTYKGFSVGDTEAVTTYIKNKAGDYISIDYQRVISEPDYSDTYNAILGSFQFIE